MHGYLKLGLLKRATTEKSKERDQRPCLHLPVPELEPMPSDEEGEAQAQTVIVIDL